MKHRAFILLLALSLVACGAAGADESPTPPPPPGGQDTIINTYLGLPAYPGSRIIEQDEDDRDSETRFESADPLQQVYGFFHNFLTQAGWQRVDLEEDSDEIEADYVRDGIELELELEHEGGNIYTLEIDIDD